MPNVEMDLKPVGDLVRTLCLQLVAENATSTDPIPSRKHASRNLAKVSIKILVMIADTRAMLLSCEPASLTEMALFEVGFSCFNQTNLKTLKEFTSFSFPVDGSWSQWSQWSLCSKTCGDGAQVRSRSCSDPKPASGGSPCSGISSQEKYCRVRDCCKYC